MRPLIADAERVRAEPGGAELSSELDAILARLRAAAQALNRRLTALDRCSSLTRPAPDLASSIVHLHINRLLGADRALESRVLGLLGRVWAGLSR